MSKNRNTGFESDFPDDEECDFDYGEDSGAINDSVSYFNNEKQVDTPLGTVAMTTTLSAASEKSPNGTAFISLKYKDNFISCFIDSMDIGGIVERIEDLLHSGMYSSLALLFSDVGLSRDPSAVWIKLEALVQQRPGSTDDTF